MHTSIEGGSTDNDVTDIAVMACLKVSDLAEITHTVDVEPRMEVKKFFLRSDSFI
jgi:hypothetical protein